MGWDRVAPGGQCCHRLAGSSCGWTPCSPVPSPLASPNELQPGHPVVHGTTVLSVSVDLGAVPVQWTDPQLLSQGVYPLQWSLTSITNQHGEFKDVG